MPPALPRVLGRCCPGAGDAGRQLLSPCTFRAGVGAFSGPPPHGRPLPFLLNLRLIVFYLSTRRSKRSDLSARNDLIFSLALVVRNGLISTLFILGLQWLSRSQSFLRFLTVCEFVLNLADGTLVISPRVLSTKTI